MEVVIVQPDIAWEDRAENHRRTTELIEAAAPSTGSLIVLPEMYASGFSMNLEKTCQGADRADEAHLSGLARRFGAHVLGGVVVPGGQGMGRNQAVAFGPGGEEVARYTKMHPFSLAGECAVHEPGREVSTFAWGGLTVAPLVCYDLRFPEPFRQAARLGADVMVVIALWPSKRQHHWLTLLQARAIENQAYVIGVNRTGNEPKYAYAGRSVVVDPHGFIVFDAGEQPKAAKIAIDGTLPSQWRAEFPALRDAGW